MKALANTPSRLAASAAITIAVAFAIGVFASQAKAGPPGNSNNSFAVGGITTVDGHVAFAAHLNLQNGNVNGHVVQDSMGTSRSGPVTCVSVCGNMAAVEWRVEHSDNSSEINQIRAFDVTDNGQPQMGLSPDLFKDKSCFNNNCTFQGGGVMPVHGNIVVKGPVCDSMN